MNHPNKSPIFPDLNEVKRKEEDLTGAEIHLNGSFMYNLFRHGEHHVALFNWTDIAYRSSAEDIGHYILNSIRCIMCSLGVSDDETRSKVIPLYQNAKVFFDSDGKVGASDLFSSLKSTLSLYQANGCARSTAPDGLHWHRLAHYAIAIRLGIDCMDLENEYEIALEEVLSRRV